MRKKHYATTINMFDKFIYAEFLLNNSKFLTKGIPLKSTF